VTIMLCKAQYHRSQSCPSSGGGRVRQLSYPPSARSLIASSVRCPRICLHRLRAEDEEHPTARCPKRTRTKLTPCGYCFHTLPDFEQVQHGATRCFLIRGNNKPLETMYPVRVGAKAAKARVPSSLSFVPRSKDRPVSRADMSP